MIRFATYRAGCSVGANGGNPPSPFDKAQGRPRADAGLYIDCLIRVSWSCKLSSKSFRNSDCPSISRTSVAAHFAENIMMKQFFLKSRTYRSEGLLRLHCLLHQPIKQIHSPPPDSPVRYLCGLPAYPATPAAPMPATDGTAGHRSATVSALQPFCGCAQTQYSRISRRP